MIVPVTLIPAGLIPGYFPGYFPGYCPDFLFLSIKQTAGVHDVISQTQQHVAPAVPGFIAAAVHGVIFQTQQLQPGCKDIVLCPDRSPLYRPFRRRSGRRSALTSRSCRCSCRPILNSHCILQMVRIYTGIQCQVSTDTVISCSGCMLTGSASPIATDHSLKTLPATT